MAIEDEMALRVDQLTNAGTYGGAVATGAASLLNWLGANQSGLTVLVMIITCLVTVISAIYGIHHRSKIREIAERRGFDTLRKGEQ